MSVHIVLLNSCIYIYASSCISMPDGKENVWTNIFFKCNVLLSVKSCKCSVLIDTLTDFDMPWLKCASGSGNGAMVTEVYYQCFCWFYSFRSWQPLSIILLSTAKHFVFPYIWPFKYHKDNYIPTTTATVSQTLYVMTTSMRR